MARVSTTDGGYGAGGPVILHESSDHSVLVPDTELLFTAQFHRAGPDLVLTGRDGQHHLVPGYFESEHHPALVAPNGAHLSPETVDLLAGSPTPGHYAQAQPTAPPDSIGKIEKVIGDVSVVRNGATVALHVGDAVFKSDVVQTGASASCGISFPDGTVLNLVANTRMALNDYAYDANSNANGALFTLVEGTFAFVAGKVAHTGDMKIATPVATMGIRGTTGVVQEQPDTAATITANAAGHTYTFAVVPDIGTGVTGMWDVYLTDANGIIQRDANGNPIVLVTVSQSGYVTYLTPQGLGQPPLVSTEPATNSQYAFEQEMLHQLFLTLNPTNLNGNNNGSSTTPPPFELPNPIPQLFEPNGQPLAINVPSGSTTIPAIVDIVVGTGPLTVVIWTAGGSGPWSSGPNWLGGAPPTSPQEVEILNPVKVTTDGADSAAGLVVAGGAILNIVSGTSFTIYDFIHGAGTIALNSSGSDPTLFIHGAVSLAGGGTIKMLGPAGEDNILGVPGTGALLINVDYTIQGTGTIGGGDGILTFENFGIVNANDGLLTINTGNQVYNDGLMEATVDPVAATAGALQIKDSVVNAGTVQADGLVAAVALSGATFDNLFSVIAKNHGIITFTNVTVTNEAISATDLTGGTINAAGGAITFDGGSIANGNMLEATNHGFLLLDNLTVTNSSAGTASVDATSALELISAAILGGTIENAGQVIVTNGASVLHGDSVTNSGTMTVEAGASLTLEGTTLINQAGGQINADGGTVDIEIDNANTTNDGLIQAFDHGTVTINVNADGSRTNGTIAADNGIVVINSNNGGGGGGGGGGDDGGGNYGLIEAINGGTVDINGGITNRAGATIEALGTGSTVNFSEQQTENLGTIKADGTGAEVDFTHGMLDNSHLIVAENGGEISLTSIMLTNDPGAFFEATQGGSITWNTGGVNNDGTIEADNNGTITFGGSIGITNDIDGTIEALSGGSIVFETSGIGSVSNDNGMIVASGGGTITFDSTLNGAENTGIIKAGAGGTIIIDGFSGGNGLSNTDGMGGIGTIEAVGTGAKVELAGATIIGGKLGTSGGGVFETVNGASTNTSTLINVILTGGTFTIDSGTILDLNGGMSGVAAYIDSTVIFEGSGTVEMDSTSASIRGGLSDGTLNNQTTIEGHGTIGTGDTPLPGVLTLINSGTIEAIDGQFTINTGTRNSATTTNSGTLEANGANAVLLIHHTNMNNAGGTIAALNGLDAVAATASVVELLDDVIVGGTLRTSNYGTIETISDNSGNPSISIFDGVTNLGYVYVSDDTTLILRDTIDQTAPLDVVTGTIALGLGGNATLEIDGTVTINGGSVQLNGGNDTIVALGPNSTLDNASTIHGAGQIGDGHGNLTLNNQAGGTIDADANGGQIVLDTGTLETNAGTLEATNGATLVIEDSLDNTGTVVATSGNVVEFLNAAVVTNDGGTLDADGGTISFATAATLITDKNGGVIEAIDGGKITLDATTIEHFGGSPINADNGTIVFIASGSVNNDNASMTVSDGGTFEFNTPTLNNSGIILVEDGTIVFDQSVTIGGTGGGVIGLDIGSTNAIVSGGSAITVTNFNNSIHGGGTIGDAHMTLINDAGGSITATAHETLTLNTGANTITNDGTMSVGVVGTLLIQSAIDNAGTISSNAAVGLVWFDGVSVDNESGGRIVATSEGEVMFAPAEDVTNRGLIAAGSADTDNGRIQFFSTTVDNAGGQIQALNNASVELDSTTITGGTLSTDTSSVIEALNSDLSTLDGVTITDGSFIQAAFGATFDLEDVTTLKGTVTFAGQGTFVLDPGVASIVGGSGGGTLDIAAGATLTGSGQIGNAGATGLALSNSGTVDADGVGAEIDIETANYTTTNTGLLEATKGGTLAIESDVNNDCGTIGASGTGSTVQLVGAINIAGGTLTTGNLSSASDGMIEIVAVANTEAILDGSAHAVTIDGYVQVDAGASLALDGTIANEGTIDLVSDSGPSPGTNLVIQTDVTLQGGGQVTLTDGGDNAIATNGSAVTLSNVDNTISGAGTIGDRGYLTLVNEHDGTVDANISGSTLTIDTSNTVTNAGTLEATNGGLLEIDDSVDNSGNVGALGGQVQIDGDVTNESTGQIGAGNGGTITFGAITVTNDAGGDIGALSGGQITFDHSHVENHGHIGPNGGTVTFDCSVVCNDSTPTKDGNGGITADGGGTIKFAYSCVTNDGEIGALDCSSITFCNSHVVNTAGTSLDGNGIVALDGGSVTFTDSCIDNTGFIRALIGSGDDGSAGTIYFTDSTVNNAGGTISAVGTGTVVQLVDTTINGGTLFTDLSGMIEVVASVDGDSVLDGSANAVTVQGVVQVEKGAALDLAGTIIDNGTIEIVSGDPDLVIVGCVTLDGNGSGTVKLDGSGADIVGATGGADTLKNSITIEGAGTIGNAELSVTNECSGIIDATGCLTVNLGSNELTNHGLLEATGGGELTLLSTVSNSNTIAAYAGSTVNLDGFIGNSDCGQVIASGHCAVVDLFNATINGGTVESDSGGLIQTVAGSDNAATQSIFDGVTIGCGSDLKVVDQTTLVLEGGTTMSGGTLSIESSGDVEIVNGGGTGGATLTDVNLHNCGQVTVDSDTTLTLSGTTVHGGAIDGADASGCVIASTIDVTGDSTFCDVNLSGGDLTVEGNVTLTLSGVTIDGTTIDDYTDSGSLVIPGTINVTGDSAINNATVEGEGGPADSGTPGAVAVACGVTLTLDDTTLEDLNVTNNGTLQVGDTHTLTLDNVRVTDNGTIDVGDVATGAILTLDDGTAITGNGTGTLTINFGNTLDVEKGANDGNNGATLDGVKVQDNGAIDIGDFATGAILTLDDGTTITGGGTAALLINANNALDVENGPNGGGATLDDVHVTDNGALDIGDVATGAILTLEDDATITGGGAGTLTISAHSTLGVETGDNGGATLDGVNVIDNGAIDIGDVASGAILTLDDGTTITGNGAGTLKINANSSLDVEHGSNFDSGGATLDGVNVTDNGALDVGDVASGAILTLDDGTTVTGCGVMTIHANSTLEVNGGTATINLVGATTNAGTIEAENGGILTIDSDLSNSGNVQAVTNGVVFIESNSVTNAVGGTISADGSNSADVVIDCSSDGTVYDHGTFLNFGTVTSSNGGDINIDSATVTNEVGGTITSEADSSVFFGVIGNGDGTTTFGTLSNYGSITADASYIGIESTTITNELGGTITADGATAEIDFDDRASGISLSNLGTITASDGGLVKIDTSTVTNSGSFEATSGGELDITNSVTNTDGTLLAASGGLLDVQGAISGGSATIQGGKLEFDSSSSVHVTFDNGGPDGTDYGLLILKDGGGDFAGTISGFAGTAADISSSDEIFLTGVTKTDFSTSYDNSDNLTTLTVDEASGDPIVLYFSGDYTGKFEFVQGAGGLEIYDPPVGGAKQAPSTATTASDGRASAPTNEIAHATDHATGPANEAGFLSDQGAAATATSQDSVASPANQLAHAGNTVTAPPPTAHTLGNSDLAAFGSDDAAVPTSGPAAGGAHSGAVTIDASIVTSPISTAIVLPGTPVLESEHPTDSTIVDGSGTAHDEVAPPTAPTAPGNEHAVAPATVTAPPPAASPTLASASLGGSGNDSFAFHPSLGIDTAQTTDAHSSELAHNNVQIAGPALAAIAPEFHQEFAFDAIHQDAAALTATVDQFHQMAANSTLLH